MNNTSLIRNAWASSFPLHIFKVVLALPAHAKHAAFLRETRNVLLGATQALLELKPLTALTLAERQSSRSPMQLLGKKA